MMVEDEIVDIGQGGEEEADDDAARMPHAAFFIWNDESTDKKKYFVWQYISIKYIWPIYYGIYYGRSQHILLYY